MNKKKKSDDINPASEMVKDFFKENPEALGLLQPQEDGHLFSKGLRDALEPFKEMNAGDCIRSPDFMKALCKHAGMTDEQFEDILNNAKEPDDS